MTATTLVWLRNDLRLADNPALNAALSAGLVRLVYILEREQDSEWPIGSASRWWLHQSLQTLTNRCRELGNELIIRQGSAQQCLSAVSAELGATQVFWNRRYEPDNITRDQAIKTSLQAQGINAESFNGALLFEPWHVSTQQDTPFRVFTPFWKHCQRRLVVGVSTTEPPSSLPSFGAAVESLALESLNLLPKIPWDTGFYRYWQPGEAGAEQALSDFIEDAIGDYSSDRDIPSVVGTSRLSPHLHFGEISPRQIWQALQAVTVNNEHQASSMQRYQAELGWREFAHHLLYHYPHTATQPMNEKFKAFQWVRADESAASAESFARWTRGETGCELVDAGMRELWHTGWMHNRVRMVVASYLTKNLGIHWLDGARWFWDTLVDADLAANTLGWQWVAGCGADAAPYFRIFNPDTQAQRFDENGEYRYRWLKGQAPTTPLVDLKQSRVDALERYQRLKALS